MESHGAIILQGTLYTTKVTQFQEELATFTKERIQSLSYSKAAVGKIKVKTLRNYIPLWLYSYTQTPRGTAPSTHTPK